MKALTGPLYSDPFPAAVAEVNAWRGKCMSELARAEGAVTEALLALAKGDPSVKLPHLVGQRYAALLEALSGQGKAEAASALQVFQRYDELRKFLCHGVSRVMLDQGGGWHVALRLIVPRGRQAERKLLLLSAKEAAELSVQLHRDQQRLGAKLRPLSGGQPAAAETPLDGCITVQVS